MPGRYPFALAGTTSANPMIFNKSIFSFARDRGGNDNDGDDKANDDGDSDGMSDLENRKKEIIQKIREQ